MHLQRYQLPFTFGGPTPVELAVEQLAEAGAEVRGAIFTRRSVVNFILDLAGYTSDLPLHQARLLEPSLGEGDFLIPALERLFSAWHASGDITNPVLALKDLIRGVELHRQTFNATKAKLLEFLKTEGLTTAESTTLAEAWIQQGDFLLTEFPANFTHVVGNPPYIRQELIPEVLMEEYRRRFGTIYDRADIYVPFIEHSLSMLAPEGKLSFICADRWMKNRYGGPLRKLVASRYHLETYVDMVNTPAFHSDVIAYPAIFVLANRSGGRTRVAHQPDLSPAVLGPLAAALASGGTQHAAVQDLEHVAISAEPWGLSNFDHLSVVRRLESDFPILEEVGCKVGIGVATGADRIFIGRFDELDVEDDRKLPLAMTRDIKSGDVEWRGYGVLNPFSEKGSLVDLKDYPRLAKYLELHGEEIRHRHVSKKNPNSWYRTIDRIYPDLALQPKLLIPDIKGQAHIVYEEGRLYPHHNLYYVTSTEWDLHALQAILKSRLGQLFIETYSTRMRGGYLRFQAQYLRRIRLPQWSNVSAKMRATLIQAAKSGEAGACDEAAFELYGLSLNERNLLKVATWC
ncbi:MAG: Eco57I restriction-modification methylase domain-containing protein [Afipia sp.]|nr:Eco57I restriction-modification methylase domain-containing protein [Afipia sp.]